jgi:RNA polymerase sigma-70 factor (ECF subfamily)
LRLRRARDIVVGPWPSRPEATPAGPDRLHEFEALTLPHATALYRTAYHLAGDVRDAEDLAQETYLRAFRGFADFRGGDIRAWLFTILRHAFLDECRRQGRRPAIAHDLDGVAGPDGGGGWSPSAESEVLRRLPSEAIARAFAALPVDWRLVVVLADVEELTYREIADVMGVPVGTVMSRLHRARQRLRQQLLDTPRATWTHDERSA